MSKRNGRQPDAAMTGTPPPVALLDVEVPTTPEAFQYVITKGCARALAMSTTAKELVDAVKAARDWYCVLYPSPADDGYGHLLKDPE